MNLRQPSMSPHDIVVLLKIVSMDDSSWLQHDLAEALGISQSEISKSINRSKYSGLLDPTGKTVMKYALLEFIIHGFRYVFPQRPGALTRGVPTAHSAEPLKNLIESSEQFVWPHVRGTVRGQAITPLYRNLPAAALNDSKLHEMLALSDALRVGKAREKQLAIDLLHERFAHGK
jgi:biotin operon repressor